MSMPRMSPTLTLRNARKPAAVLALLACTACTPPPDSPTEKPAEPQATQLRDAIRDPLDRAHATQHAVDADTQRTRGAIDAASG